MNSTMTTAKTIEILLDLLGEGPYFPPDDRREAILKAISALNLMRSLEEFLHHE